MSDMDAILIPGSALGPDGAPGGVGLKCSGRSENAEGRGL